MTALAENTQRLFAAGVEPEFEDFAVKAAFNIFDGAAICSEADGLARPIVASLTTPKFHGFVERGGDNTSGASGDIAVRTRQAGTLFDDTIAGATDEGDIGSTVYMSDDGSGLTLTSTNNVEIGKIENFVDGGFRVRFKAAALR